MPKKSREPTNAADLVEKRFRTILRGALDTPPISNEEIVRRSRALKPNVRVMREKRKRAAKPASSASRASE